jgi:hypothetical protein
LSLQQPLPSSLMPPVPPRRAPPPPPPARAPRSPPIARPAWPRRVIRVRLRATHSLSGRWDRKKQSNQLGRIVKWWRKIDIFSGKYKTKNR